MVMAERSESVAKQTKKIIACILAFALLTVPAFAAQKNLVPIGHTTGIKIFCDGVMVVRTVPINTAAGSSSPAKNAGLRAGDVVVKINDKEVSGNESLKEEISKGKPVEVTYCRDGNQKTVTAVPVRDDSGTYQLGLWVRDSMAGIGTVTYYDPDSGEFGALGHGICDTETNQLVPMKAGSIMGSTVKDVHKGSVGSPGELVGDYELKEDCGFLNSNNDKGIFGVFTKEMSFLNKTALPVATKQEVKLGAATILSNIQGNDVREYQIKITQIYQTEEENGKSMMIEITDPELIAKTGGIVQGMSGSPIIQGGKLVGAVTHVLVNDPTRGYGIFIENMLAEAE